MLAPSIPLPAALRPYGIPAFFKGQRLARRKKRKAVGKLSDGHHRIARMIIKPPLVIFVDAHAWPANHRVYLNGTERTVSLDLYNAMKADPKLAPFPA